MTTNKPRICEVLGVEDLAVSKAMEIVTSALAEDKLPGSWYYSWQSNIACTIMDNSDVDHETANKIAVRFLERLCERQPRFTEDEVALALDIVRVFGREDAIRRTDDGVLCYGSIILNQILFPSIRPGQAVTITDIIKNEKEK